MPITTGKVLICTVDLNPCPPGNIETTSAVIIPTDYSSLLGILLDNGGVDWSVVQTVFQTGLVVFAAGIAVGFLINIVRKFRTP